MRKVAIIPVKHISERVKNKNFKEFISGISLFELKLKQLLNKDCFDQIYISTNSPIVEKILKSSSYKMVKILKRDDVFCTNDVSWSDVIHYVISSIPEEDNTCVSWCHTTSPMFNQYEECLEVFLKNYSENKFNGLVTVANFNEFLIDEKTNTLTIKIYGLHNKKIAENFAQYAMNLLDFDYNTAEYSMLSTRIH